MKESAAGRVQDDLGFEVCQYGCNKSRSHMRTQPVTRTAKGASCAAEMLLGGPPTWCRPPRGRHSPHPRARPHAAPRRRRCPQQRLPASLSGPRPASAQRVRAGGRATTQPQQRGAVSLRRKHARIVGHCNNKIQYWVWRREALPHRAARRMRSPSSWRRPPCLNCSQEGSSSATRPLTASHKRSHAPALAQQQLH